MEVTALCIRLLILVIQLCYSQKSGFPRVVPDRQQHFEYESVVFNCGGLEGLTEWRVMRKLKAVDTICASHWETSTGPCTIKPAFSSDSGAYWCQAGEKRSNAVNITITACPVILESPVLPVTEGDTVTLHCRKMNTSSLTANFYKDGFLIKSNSNGTMTIHTMFKSDEGLYKCSVSQTEESAESWLTVRAFNNDTQSADDSMSPPLSIFSRVFGVMLLVALGLVLGLLYSRKRNPDRFLSILPCTNK